jgi:hypothetical protein
MATPDSSDCITGIVNTILEQLGMCALNQNQNRLIYLVLRRSFGNKGLQKLKGTGDGTFAEMDNLIFVRHVRI